jgi:HAD superfamily hydrolase (TIGR01484 family)
MRFLALATDYDGTLAVDGAVSESAWAAASRLHASGRKLILVTGRELDDLRRACAYLERFDRVVAENGAILWRPDTNELRMLAPPPLREFVQKLRDGGVEQLSVGAAIVATVRPFETIVLQAIRDLCLELQVIFNKSSVMVLPSGVTKATGLAAALDDLGLSPHNIVGIGDAENDHAFLGMCECSAAVDDAVSTLLP